MNYLKLQKHRKEFIEALSERIIGDVTVDDICNLDPVYKTKYR